MITTTWTNAPADLLGLGGTAMRPCPSAVSGSAVPADVAMVAPTARVQGMGLPIGGTVVRVREAFPQTGTPTLTHNYIGAKNDGTSLGIHTRGRPLS
jgi:hypothetical protein